MDRSSKSFRPLAWGRYLLPIAAILFGLLPYHSRSQVHAQSASQPGELRVMSFNIRYGTAQDGVNHWDKRQGWVVETIRAFAPDLLGTQETLGFQRDFLAMSLADYDGLGVGRDDGAEKGEMMALFYRRDRFEKLDGGHFWLSESPAEVGSKSWDSSLPRMVTWVKLRQRDRESAKPILFLNTHYDHRGETARAESSKLIRRKIAELGAGCDVVVTGDFNAPEASQPYAALFGPDGAEPSPLVDTYRVANPNRGLDEGTFSGFRADATAGPRIDWIAASRGWKVLRGEIDRTAKEDRTPSDHFPVIAILSRD
jgi:endonuclease/exonuclease/phosphatase family metal-dependent hydrolase